MARPFAGRVGYQITVRSEGRDVHLQTDGQQLLAATVGEPGVAELAYAPRAGEAGWGHAYGLWLKSSELSRIARQNTAGVFADAASEAWVNTDGSMARALGAQLSNARGNDRLTPQFGAVLIERAAAVAVFPGAGKDQFDRAATEVNFYLDVFDHAGLDDVLARELNSGGERLRNIGDVLIAITAPARRAPRPLQSGLAFGVSALERQLDVADLLDSDDVDRFAALVPDRSGDTITEVSGTSQLQWQIGKKLAGPFLDGDRFHPEPELRNDGFTRYSELNRILGSLIYRLPPLARNWLDKPKQKDPGNIDREQLKAVVAAKVMTELFAAFHPGLAPAAHHYQAAKTLIDKAAKAGLTISGHLAGDGTSDVIEDPRQALAALSARAHLRRRHYPG